MKGGWEFMSIYFNLLIEAVHPRYNGDAGVEAARVSMLYAIGNYCDEEIVAAKDLETAYDDLRQAILSWQEKNIPN